MITTSVEELNSQQTVSKDGEPVDPQVEHNDEELIVVRILRTGDVHKRLLRVGQISAGCGWCAHNKVL